VDAISRSSEGHEARYRVEDGPSLWSAAAERSGDTAFRLPETLTPTHVGGYDLVENTLFDLQGRQ